MTRKIFMEQLGIMLSNVPEADRRDALIYYTEYFDDAGITDEMEVPTSVGTPDQIVKRIMKDLGSNNTNYYGEANKTENNNYYYGDVTNKSGTSDNTVKIIVAILIAVVTFPIWSGIAIGVLGIVVGIVLGLAGTIIGLLIGGVALVITAFTPIAASIAASLFLAGIGIVCIGVAILLVIPEALFCITFLPWLVTTIVEAVQKIIKKEGAK